ncbi:MAG: hypothetical protein V8R14_01870 [Clostridia bacterium]
MSIIENENLKGEQKVELTVAEEMSGKRLDSVLAGMMPEYSRSFIQKLFENGSITVGGDVCSEKKRKAGAGDLVEMSVPQPEQIEVKDEDIPLDIVYEDDELLVVDEPAGMVVHPAPETIREHS